MSNAERRTIRQQVEQEIRKAVSVAYPALGDIHFEVSKPREKTHGDFASNIAMVSAKSLGAKPVEIAKNITGCMDLPSDLITSAEIKGPGFINLTLSAEAYVGKLREIALCGDDEAYGSTDIGGGKNIQVEFVSANPTGPLNVVSARAAAVGDSLVRLLGRLGYEARSEFYINDSGTQVELLGESLKARFREILGHRCEIPEGGYPGQYLIDIAGRVGQLAEWADLASIAARRAKAGLDVSDEEATVGEFLAKEAMSADAGDEAIRSGIERHLAFKETLSGEVTDLWPALYVCHLSRDRLDFKEMMASLVWLDRYLRFVSSGAPPASDTGPEPQQKSSEVFLGRTVEGSEFDFSGFAVAEIVRQQRSSLERFGSRPEGGLHFDSWFRESSLKDDVTGLLKTLVSDGRFVAEREGAVWLKGVEETGEDEWVIRRSTGQPTYFLSDIAYHINKRRRDFDQVIDIWGPDHHGHVGRMQAAMQIVSRLLPDIDVGPDWLRILIAQQVNLIRAGERVQMSKRAGEYVTLDDVVDEVGADVARFFFLMRRCNSHLDFDLDLAKQQSDENPVYYVQYAHARISSIIEFARQNGFEEIPPEGADLSLLSSDEEIEVIKALADFDDLVVGAAVSLEPHRLTSYLIDLAAKFHRFYHNHRVVSEDRAASEARLYLCYGVRTVIRSALYLLGISAPEKM
jgi:arginyl-tRNA synthetase